MSKLLYLDVFRMTSPGETLKRKLFDFYVFGSFDAIKVETTPGEGSISISTFQELHSITKQRRGDLPAHFDEQPMHLYTPKDDAGDIFRIDGALASQPLVLTLIQLDDYQIRENTPDELIDHIDKYLRELIREGGFGSVRHEVFFCLGEADAVVAFRACKVSDIGRLIFRLKLHEIESKNGNDPDRNQNHNEYRILSASSHCAFPNAACEETVEKNILEWSRVEKDIKFFTLFDTSYGLDNNYVPGPPEAFLYNKLLLGEWDYATERGASMLPEYLARHVLRPLTDFDEAVPGSFRSAYSIPVISLQNSDLQYAKSERRPKDNPKEKLPGEYFTAAPTPFSRLSENVRNLSDIYGASELTSKLSGMIDSMHSTISGILKHLLQLRDGRFQYDLYAFLFPAFTALPKITENVNALIEMMQDNYSDAAGKEAEKKDLKVQWHNTISVLLDNYIHDTARLLAELQHLFSVLSISPHTYLESFGSNMRSITASSKLLVAYQGIAYSLSRNFPMELRNGGSSETANEVMLVIPYRRIKPHTRVLYDYTSPENRIVYIRFNASDMFQVQPTIFRLLHECGHHILSYDFRMERIDYYFEAYAGYLLDQAFSSIYLNPHKSIPIAITGDADFPKLESNPQMVRITTSEDVIRNAIIYKIRESSKLKEQLKQYWEKEYSENSNIKTLAEPIALQNAFSNHLADAGCYYIEARIAELEASKNEGAVKDNALVKEIEALLSQVIVDFFKDVMDDEYNNRIMKDDNELWSLIELRSIYRSFPSEKRFNIAEFICRGRIRNSYRLVADNVKDVFSDIYSDIFALEMLNISRTDAKTQEEEAEKYIALLRDEAGFRLKEEFSVHHHLLRFVSVLQEYFGFSQTKADDLILNVLKLPDEDREFLKKQLMDVRTRIGFKTVLNYTQKLCIRTIRKQAENNENLKRDISKLKDMYFNSEQGKNLKKLMDAVYYFWKASTHRTEGM